MNRVKRMSSNPSSFKSRFSRRFLRALMKIRRRARSRSPTASSATSCSSSSSSATEIFRRYRKVKIAANKSMALAVGSRRAWSRALLWKIQYKASRRRHHMHRLSVRRISNNIHPNMIRKRHLKEKKKKRNEEEVGGFCHANELRKLVPGGESMDLCSLLDETAHYLKCLVAQVQVMRSIDDFYSV